MNVMDRADAEARNDVLTGTIYIFNIPAYTLFDSGASCSFISSRFVRSNGIGPLVYAGFLLHCPLGV